MHVSAIASTRSQTVLANARKYMQMQTHATQTHANKRTQTIAAIDAWAISACKRDCVLRVGSKTFRMYYSTMALMTADATATHYLLELHVYWYVILPQVHDQLSDIFTGPREA